jgi:hypothetical protein
MVLFLGQLRRNIPLEISLTGIIKHMENADHNMTSMAKPEPLKYGQERNSKGTTTLWNTAQPLKKNQADLRETTCTKCSHNGTKRGKVLTIVI